MATSLTPTQQSIVDHDDGALLVVAGPGSGKTRVLTERIRRLLARPEEHFRVLALTFTNKAANEMSERLSDVPQIVERGLIGTMHSFCVEVLANRGKSVGIDGLPHIFENYADRKQVLREAVQRDHVASQLLSRAGDTKAQNFRLDSWMKGIGDAKNALCVPAMVDDEDLRHIYELYDASIRACGAVDFDDLLLLAYRVFEERPAVAAFYRRQFRYICVDEAQDLNEAQYRVLCALCSTDYFNVMMVGDPKQAIFTWNGGDPKYLELFERDFAATRVELRENFRSSKSVIAAAQALSPGYVAEEVFPIDGKVEFQALADEEREASYVAENILRLVEEGHSDVEGPITLERCAVLGRTRFVFGAIVEAFDDRAIKYYKKLSGPNVQSGSELVGQFELALRALANPLDRLHVAMLAKLWKTGLTAEQVYEGLDLRDLSGMDVLSRLRSAASGQNAEILSRVVDVLEWSSDGYFKLVPGLDLLEEEATAFDDEPRNRVSQDVKEWRQHWDYFVRSEQGGSHRVGSFLSQVALGTTQQPSLEGVALLTVHSAKGMEFDVVFVVGLNEGTFPDYRARPGEALEEERRNAFVAVTRSKRLLFLSYPELKLMPWGEEKKQRPSQFLEAIVATLPKAPHE